MPSPLLSMAAGADKPFGLAAVPAAVSILLTSAPVSASRMNNMARPVALPAL